MREGYLLSRRATLFSQRLFTAANLAGFAVGVGMFGAIMFVPLWVQGVMGAGFVLLATMNAASTTAHATVAMLVTGLGLGLLIQNLMLVVQNGVPSRHLGAATSAAQCSRSVGGTIGVAVMGAILAAGLPAGGGPQELAHAIHPVFVIGIPLMAVTFVLVLLIPELPLRRTVREAVPA